MVSSPLDVSLLESVKSDHGVDLCNVNLVQRLEGGLDLVLVSLQATLENQCVTVLNPLDGGLRGN